MSTKKNKTDLRIRNISRVDCHGDKTSKRFDQYSSHNDKPTFHFGGTGIGFEAWVKYFGRVTIQYLFTKESWCPIKLLWHLKFRLTHHKIYFLHAPVFYCVKSIITYILQLYKIWCILMQQWWGNQTQK